MNIARTIAAPALVFSMTMLSACGGGGGDGDSAPVPAHSMSIGTSDAQGVYSGTSSNGNSFVAVVLDNDEYYSIYGPLSNDVFNVTGLVQGNGQSGNGLFSSSNLIDFSSSGAISGSLTASYVAGVSFSGTITEGGSSFTFNGSAVPASEYNYDTPATLSRVTGTWSLSNTGGGSLNIDAAGSFSGTSDGCAFSGTVLPRASGKNVFDMSVTFGPSPCMLANQSGSGIALEISEGTTQSLIVPGVINGRTDGAIILASRTTQI